MSWKSFSAATMLTALMLSLMFISLSGSQTSMPYDPWADINDDGKIDMRDIGYEARLFGTTGDPIKPVVIQGYNWSLKSYTINIPAGQRGNISFATGGYRAVTVGLNVNASSIENYVSVKTGFLLGNHHAYLESFNVSLGEYVAADRHTEFPDCMWIEPVNINLIDKPLGYTFNVTVWLKISSSASFTWQMKLCFDPTFLRAKRAGYTAGTVSEWATHRTGGATVSTSPYIDNTKGYVLHGESCMGEYYVPAPVTASLCWIEFEVVGTPPVKSMLSISNEDTFILDPNVSEISIFKQDAAAIAQRQYVTRTYTVIGPTLIIEYYNPNNVDITLNMAAYLTT